MRSERQSQDLSQESLGGLADLDRTYVSGLERGVRNPTLTTAAKLAAALDIPLSELIKSAEHDPS